MFSMQTSSGEVSPSDILNKGSTSLDIYWTAQVRLNVFYADIFWGGVTKQHYTFNNAPGDTCTKSIEESTMQSYREQCFIFSWITGVQLPVAFTDILIQFSIAHPHKLLIKIFSFLYFPAENDKPWCIYSGRKEYFMNTLQQLNVFMSIEKVVLKH